MENVYKICRLCCENRGEIYIFEKNNAISIISQIKYACPNVNIAEDDYFQHICWRCKEELSLTYIFILKCESADKRYRMLHQPNIKNEFESNSQIKVEGDDNCEPKNNDRLKCKNDTTFTAIQEDSKINVKKKENIKSNFIICNICHKLCKSYSTYKIHRRSHSNEKPYGCEFCDKKYKDMGGLKRHIERNHVESRRRNFICDYCGKAFYSKNEVKIHMRIHTGESPYVCSMCPLRFKQIGAKLRHEQRHIGERNKICSVCDKKFVTKDELHNHQRVHSSEKKYSCVICSALFKHRSSLKNHIKLHNEPNKFVCSFCSHTFSTKGNLTTHLTRLHSSKSGHCNICNKDVPDIKMHMNRHAGVKSFLCEHCPKGFLTKNALARHIGFLHSKSNKFNCTHHNCLAAFPLKTMLEYHIARQHIKVKSHKCDKCPRAFYRKSDLSRHILGIHKEKAKCYLTNL